MKILLVPLAGLAVLLLYLWRERVSLRKELRALPLRVAVTGTRGKSTVTRLAAAVLREAGYRVLAKTTGSKPVMIFPDGREAEIERAGKPTILEQKNVVRAARAAHADALVVEMMSIRPETLAVESHTLLRPRLLVVTNVRLDHLDDMGRTKEQIAASLASAIPYQGTVLVPDEEFYPVFQEAAEERGSKVVKIPPLRNAPAALEFPENVRLVLGLADVLGIPWESGIRGMAKARPDFGGLKVWKVRPEPLKEDWYLTSMFAANEPESTAKALAFLRERYPRFPRKMLALIALREDRSDRTRQWLEALRAGFFDGFEEAIFIGDHARALGRKALSGPTPETKVSAWPARRPDKIMDRIFTASAESRTVVGMGNMGGLGGQLVEYWARIGEAI